MPWSDHDTLLAARVDHAIGRPEQEPSVPVASRHDPPKLDRTKQGKHVPGSANHDPTRSTLTADADILLATFAGRGQPANGVARGEPGFRERFDTGGPVIGIYRDPRTGAETATTRGVLHYSSRGAHIVPARPA